jgi:hypothetical protein
MGAEQFTVTARGATAREAFDAAVAEAQYDYGHAGYTGTIAEKDEYIVISGVSQDDGTGDMTREQAVALAEKLMAEDDPRVSDKWGPAGAIAFGDQDGEPGWLFFGWASS